MRLAGRDLMLSETIRSEGSGIVARILRLWETNPAMTGGLNQTHTEKAFGRMSQQWLNEYVAEAGKHDASW